MIYTHVRTQAKAASQPPAAFASSLGTLSSATASHAAAGRTERTTTVTGTWRKARSPDHAGSPAAFAGRLLRLNSKLASLSVR